MKRFILFVLLSCLLFACGPAEVAPDFIDASWYQAQLVDEDWYRETLVETTNHWNGGLEGKSGMGAYTDDFSGYFHVELDRIWNPRDMTETTAVAQSRAIYLNTVAYRAADSADQARFLQAATDGANFLLDAFLDDEYGGYIWAVDKTGNVTSDIKHGYGNVHPILAFAHLYEIGGDQRYYDAMMLQLNVVADDMLNPNFPGAIYPGRMRDFSQFDEAAAQKHADVAYNNIDSSTHYFEALLAAYDVATEADRALIRPMIIDHGNFIVSHLYTDQTGYSDRGYVAFYYGDDWEPSSIPYTRDRQWSGAGYASPPHGMEIAFFMSRAVERGFDASWLDTARKMVHFADTHAYEEFTHTFRYELVDYDGQPFPSNPDNDQLIWWSQSEALRTYLHFTVVRGWDYGDRFLLADHVARTQLTDQEHGGWYFQLKYPELKPPWDAKGSIWKVAYHYAMYFDEAIRLGSGDFER